MATMQYQGGRLREKTEELFPGTCLALVAIIKSVAFFLLISNVRRLDDRPETLPGASLPLGDRGGGI